MTRVRRGYIARRRRKKMRLFVSSFRGAHSKTICIIAQQKIRALFSAHRDRRKPDGAMPCGGRRPTGRDWKTSFSRS